MKVKIKIKVVLKVKVRVKIKLNNRISVLMENIKNSSMKLKSQLVTKK